MADDTTKKRRGRPPLSDEERELRRIETNKKQAERLKRNGYAAQKKYRETHSYKKNYEPKIKIPLEFRSNLDKLLSKTGMTITELFVGAVEEKYAITLRYPIDKPAKK